MQPPKRGNARQPGPDNLVAGMQQSQPTRHPNHMRDELPSHSIAQVRRFSNLQVAESLLRAAQAHLAEEIELRRRNGPGAETRRLAVVALDAEVVRRELSRFLAGGEIGGASHE
jgi:hypothetical protein